ncbi:MAG: thymidylate synthase [Candidatus Paceibacterota bacterium]
MLILKANTPKELYEKAFLEVYKLPNIEEDPKNYKDVSALLTLENYNQDEGVVWNNEGFHSSFDYTKYIIEGDNQIQLEEEYYNKEFIQFGKLESFLKYFNNDKTTKKGLINLLDDDSLSHIKPFPCLVYVWFRKIGDTLHMNCHMRANDAYKILIMDLHVGSSLHFYVADRLGLKRGNYNHFVDSLHFYHRNKIEIDKLYRQLTSERLTLN